MNRNLRTRALIGTLAAACLIGASADVRAQQPPPTTFGSANDASRALVQAVQSPDEGGLEAILGAGADVTSTGDATTDALERGQFVRKYQEMHRLVREPNGMVVLYVGAENWPFPIPLASRQGRWFFDSRSGAEEILVRRIGEHESNAIDACRNLAAASPGLASTLNNETADGYRFGTVGDSVVGASTARTTSRNTIANVKFVAYPVQYRSSGVMTFIATGDGAVYQRDLGPETSQRAEAITARVPRTGWVLVRE